MGTAFFAFQGGGPALAIGLAKLEVALFTEAEVASGLEGPAAVAFAVNEHGEILYVHGRSGQYLELPAGEASLNLLRAAREGLRIELANALRAVVAKRQPVSYKDLEVRTNGGFSNVDVTVELADGSAGSPLPAPERRRH